MLQDAWAANKQNEWSAFVPPMPVTYPTRSVSKNGQPGHGQDKISTRNKKPPPPPGREPVIPPTTPEQNLSLAPTTLPLTTPQNLDHSRKTPPQLSPPENRDWMRAGTMRGGRMAIFLGIVRSNP